jgi:catalase
VEEFLAAHPAALRFVKAEKPFPRTFAEEAFYGVNAYKFVDSAGKGTFIRYRVIPVAGIHHLSADEAKGKSPTYLFDDVGEHLEKLGPIEYRLVVQVAEEGDTTDDSTVLWPDERKIVELGTLKLEKVAEDQGPEQKKIIFDPAPRVKGIEESGDPLIEYRAAVYLISGRERRAAKA